MTRVLSELLGENVLTFRQGLSRLESASGHASTDIRLTAEVERATRLKLRELGLDPKDTTGTELYAALQQRVRSDDERLEASLRTRFGEADAMHINISKVLSELPVAKSCFALKIPVGKQLLKKLPPKQTMKALGYRSFDSMVRREQLLAIEAAAWVLESASWHKAMIDSYRKLDGSDFEIRPVALVAPNTKHWQDVATQIIAQKKHAVIGLKEFGAVVLLPFPAEKPPAATFATLLMALHEINEVRSSGTFLKLYQVRPDFGTVVQGVVADEPALKADLFDGPLPWQIVQRYYARFADRFREDLFEPHIQKEDLTWHSVEKALSYIEPSLEFWHHTSMLGLIDGRQPVSLNVIDAALNFCNQLPYEQRIVHYFRRSLWSELVIRYLKHENLEETVLHSLESQLVDEPQVL